MLRARKSKRQSTSQCATSSPATPRIGMNKSSGAPSTLPPQNAATKHPPVLLPGDPSALLKATSCPRFTKTTIHPQFHCLLQPQVLFQVELNYHIHYFTLYPQLSITICPLFPLLILHPHQCFALLWHSCCTTHERKDLGKWLYSTIQANTA